MWVEADELIASSNSQYRIGKITKGGNLCRKRQVLKKHRALSSVVNANIKPHHSFSVKHAAVNLPERTNLPLFFHPSCASKVDA
jgi:hypothetical protein